MAQIYISSTFQDLQEFRVEVYKAARRLGHMSTGMEDWAATDVPALETSLRAVRESDVVIVLVAWRYGYVPAGYNISITELEVNAAQEAGIPCLFFLVPDKAPWPPAYIDERSERIRAFRSRLLENHTVHFFTKPEEVAQLVAVALHAWVAQGTPTPLPAPTTMVSGDAPPGPEVFVSYAHEDVAAAELLAARLVEERWSVFWDRTIPVGLTWDDIVEKALDAAKCVVVLWSSSSRDSEWVRIEANEGAERGILAPASIASVKIPLRFRRIQAADLIDWTQKPGDTEGLQALLGAVRRCLRTTHK